MPLRTLRHAGAPLTYVAAVALTAAAVLLRWMIDPLLQDQLALVTLFGAVALAVWRGGRGPAILVAVLGYVACQVLFVETRREALAYTFGGDAVGLIAYLVSCGAIIGFGEGMRRAQQGEHARADLLRFTLASIGDAVVTTDTDCRITYLNGTAEHLTGWTHGEASGQPLESVFQIIDDTSRQPVDSPVRLALLDERRVGLPSPTLLVARDGTERVIDGSASPIRDSDGQVSGAVLIFRDVSERRRSERERERASATLRSSEERLRLAQQVGRIGTFELNLLTGENTWTPELEAMHGLPPGGFAGTQEAWVTLLHPDDREAAAERVRHAISHSGATEGEWRIIRPDGSQRWIAGRAVLLRDETGRPLRFIGMNIDITDRKRAEEATARLAAIVASSDDAILSKDLSGRIASWNKGAERLFGYTADEIVGQSVQLLIPKDRQEEEPEMLARIASGQHVYHYETVRQGKDGTLVDISLTVSPVLDEAGVVIGASTIARDISERRRIEDALKQADQRKDEFLATLAHELRNPLAPIRNAIGILQTIQDQPSAVEKTRAMMERQLTQMVRLIDDLMDVSRVTRGRLELRVERVNLAEVMQQAVETCQPLIEASAHALTVSVPLTPVYLDADPVRLAQVLSNLLSNACKFTPPGGTIALEAITTDTHISVQIRDSGVGLRADEMSRIFEMFSRIDKTIERSQAGLGLGLSLSKRLIELHDGRIEVQSEGPGLGSVFTVCLPVRARASLPAASSLPAMEPNGPSRRILVVDDSIDSADSLSMLLQIHGHETATAYDGIQAIERARDYRPQLVLLDIGLPRLNGYEACRRIREQTWGRDMTLIALTGWGQDKDRQLALEAGFDGHMVKPIDHSALMQLLASLAR